MQVITDDLEGPPVMKGELAFTEETVTELLNGTQSVSGLTFEVELRNTVSETSRTVLQASCTILSNLASP